MRTKICHWNSAQQTNINLRNDAFWHKLNCLCIIPIEQYIYADENLYTGKEKAFQNEFWFPK